MCHPLSTTARLGTALLALGLALVAGCTTHAASRMHRSDELPPTDRLSPDALEPGGNRGVVACDEDDPCYSSLPPLSRDDVTVKLMRVEPDGSLRPLANGESMRSGERFTVLLHSAREVYVYLFHRDPNGRTDELIRASGLLGGSDCTQWNRLAAGQALRLPDDGAHYALRGADGTEWLQAVLSEAPICENSSRNAYYTTGWGPCARHGLVCLPVFTIRHVVGT